MLRLIDHERTVHQEQRLRRNGSDFAQTFGLAGLWEIKKLEHRRDEIAQRGYDAAAKHLMPDAINGHTRGERIVAVGNPVSQLKSAALFGADLRSFSRLARYLNEPARNLRAELLRVAMDIHFAVADLR